MKQFDENPTTFAVIKNLLHPEVNFSNVDGLSPLHICAELGRSRLSRLLCEASGDVDLMDVGGSFDQSSTCIFFEGQVDVSHCDITL